MSDKRNNPRYKLNFGLKTKLFALLGFLVIAVGLLTALGKAITVWYDTHTIKFNKVVEIKLQKPIEIEERKIPEAEVIRIVEQVPAPDDLETDIEHYIYEVFGIELYRYAIALAKAESNLNCNALNINSNGTADFSVFQINSIWLKYYSLSELTDCKRNIEIAREIWDRGDGEMGNNKGSFQAWVAAKDGSYLKFLE